MINKMHKTSIPGKPFKTDMHGKVINKGDILNCSVCGKEFPVDDDTCYICNGGYTCSWKCFLVNNTEVEKKKLEEKAKKALEETVYLDTEPKKKRGRPKKNV